MATDQLPDAGVVVYHQDDGARETLIRMAQGPSLSWADRRLACRPRRHGKGEGAPQAGLAEHRDRATVHLDQLAHDAQAEAGATMPARAAAITLDEFVEDDPLRLGRNPNACVLDGDPHHAARGLRHDLDVAALGELHSVGEQIDEDLLESRGISLDRW